MNLESALKLHAAGNLAAAEQAYRTVISENSKSNVAFEKLGLICVASGRVDEGIQLIETALKLNPGNPDLFLNLAVAHKMQGRLEDSIRCNRKALEMGAKYPEAHLNLGDVLTENGQGADAIASYKKAIELRSNYPEAYNNMGTAFFAQGKLEDAARCLRKSVQQKPDYALAHHNMSLVLQQQGLFNEAIASCKSAIKYLPNPASFISLGNALLESHYSTKGANRLAESQDAYRKALEFDANSLEALTNLGLALTENNKNEEAIVVYRKAISIAPENAAAFQNLGLLLSKEANRIDEAMSCFKQALNLLSEGLNQAPTIRKLGEQLLNLKTLPIIYNQAAEIPAAREAFQQSLEQASALIEQLGRPLKPAEIKSLKWILFMVDNFYISYQQCNDRDLMAHYATLATAILRPEVQPYLSHGNIAEREPNAKIRLGIASEFLRYHHGSYWAYDWLINLPKTDYEFFFYSINGQVDDVTQKFAALGTYRWLPFRSDKYLGSLETICKDKLDIFIITDVGMSAFSRVLSLMRVAPVQCAGWAHPVTTGSPNIDYFLSNELMEVLEPAPHYSEQVIKLPQIGLVFNYPDHADTIARRSEFELPDNKIIYGTVQSLFKYLPQYDHVYPAIAKQVPNSFFTFISNEDDSITSLFKERLRLCFEQNGINFDERVKILPRLTPAKFMQLLSVLDINLDSIGWNGGFTTMRSIAMNCPVVSLAGPFMRGRHTYAMYKMIEVEGLVADSVESYIDIASKLGLDSQLRNQFVESLKANKHKLFNDTSCVPYLDKFMKSKVQPGSVS